MKLTSVILLLVLCAVCQAVSITTITTVSLTLLSLNAPVSCFFGVFRRRKSPPVEETIAIPQNDQTFPYPNVPASGGIFNPFGGFGAGGMFFPGFGGPFFGSFGSRFPPQSRPPQQKPVQSPLPLRLQPQPVFPQQGMLFQPISMPQNSMPSPTANLDQDDVPGLNIEEAESFFTLLSETDESKCISRLVCEMGANPESGGEFGQTIVEIIGSLNDFPAGSKVSEYNEVLNIGVAEGLSSCLSKFSVCDEESYQLVKKAQLEDDGEN